MKSKPNPPAQALHALVPLKLDMMGQIPTEDLIRSLKPGQVHGLKARPDGTILDGHHRIHILRSRGVAVDDLPREIIEKDAEH